jgi:hypothetical protein
MSMIPKLGELQALTDEEIAEKYDSAAERTVVGTDFYLDELNRREFRRASEAALAEARAARKLAQVNALVAFIAAVSAVIVIFIPLWSHRPGG